VRTMGKEREFYDESRDYYSVLKKEYTDNSRWKQNRVKNVLELSDIQKADMILDLACGVGTFSIESKKQNAKPVGVDFSFLAVKVAKKLFEEHTGEDGFFLVADARQLPFKSESFDKIICADFVEHLYPDDYLEVLRECWRVSKKSGSLIVYTPSRTHIFEVMMKNDFILKKDESHVDIKDMDYILETLEGNRFQVEKKYFKPSHLRIFKNMETILMTLPWLGRFFRRRICVRARKI